MLLLLPPLDPVSLSQQSPVWLVLLGLGLVVLYGGGLYAQVRRYRYVSSHTERQQTKWVIYGFALWLGYMLLSTIPYFYLGTLPPDAPTPWWGPVSVLGWFLSLNIVPVALAIAVTRYRLWDIDLVMNRTLVYGGLTASVVAVYALVVGGMGAVFHTRANWPITLIATGLVAVLFQPLRERLQQSVNRLLYGDRDEPFEVLARLGRRMEDTFAPESVLAVMVETVAETLKLPFVAIGRQQGTQMVITESYGRPVTGTEDYPLTYRGTVIGRLLVARRAPDEPFSEGEDRLLRNIARQAGAAVHALQLANDLQRARQQVVTSREEERRRLRRDLHDGLGPSLAAQLLKVGSARALLTGQPEMTDRLLTGIETDIATTLGEVRRIVYALRPAALDQLGLAGALCSHAAACESGEFGGTGRSLAIRVEIPEDLPPLPAATEVAAYHIAREGLTNVVRHARARRCTLRLALEGGENERLLLCIEDDGVGLAEEAPLGVGLSSMRERAAELGGECQIASESGAGTRLTAVLPLNP
jgi:signal transduction histidine kinase